MQICIFEDEKHKDFYPLTYSRPVYDLVCGVKSIKEKIISEFPGVAISLHCRKYLEDFVRLKNPDCKINETGSDERIFINGRVSSVRGLGELINKNEEDVVYKNGETLILAKLGNKKLSGMKNKFPELINNEFFNEAETKETELKCYNYLWEMISDNGNQIKDDIEKIVKNNKSYRIPDKIDGVSFIEKEKIYVGKDVTVKPGVVIDAAKGPVLIDDNVFIYPNAVIEGPVYIGKGTKIKSHATICENVSIGSVCKIGGEIEVSIVLPYTNKQHSGFIGHSYLGSWVNLGADTNCSDLKNNYSTVKVNFNGKMIDTQSQFLGVIIGDHSKTAINTMLNTGTIIGFSSNVFGAGFPPKYIPSFSWGGAEELSEYDVQKSMETARIVLKRRGVEFLSGDVKIFENTFNLTMDERNG